MTNQFCCLTPVKKLLSHCAPPSQSDPGASPSTSARIFLESTSDLYLPSATPPPHLHHQPTATHPQRPHVDLNHPPNTPPSTTSSATCLASVEEPPPCARARPSPPRSPRPRPSASTAPLQHLRARRPRLPLPLRLPRRDRRARGCLGRWHLPLRTSLQHPFTKTQKPLQR